MRALAIILAFVLAGSANAQITLPPTPTPTPHPGHQHHHFRPRVIVVPGASFPYQQQFFQQPYQQQYGYAPQQQFAPQQYGYAPSYDTGGCYGCGGCYGMQQQQQVYQQPVYQAPAAPVCETCPQQQPVYQQPSYEQPSCPTPAAAPVYQQPSYASSCPTVSAAFAPNYRQRTVIRQRGFSAGYAGAAFAPGVSYAIAGFAVAPVCAPSVAFIGRQRAFFGGHHHARQRTVIRQRGFGI